MAKTEICNITTTQLLALAQAVKLNDCNDLEALPHGKTESVDFTVRVKGTVKRGESYTRRGTDRARTPGAMVMLLVISGVTREHSPKKLIEVWRDFGSLDKKGMEARIASLDAEDAALYNECMALFQSEIVNNLPVIPAKGGVKFEGQVSREE